MPKYESTLPSDGEAYILEAFSQGKSIKTIKQGIYDLGYRMEERNLYYRRRKWVANTELHAKLEVADWADIDRLVKFNVRIEHLQILMDASAWVYSTFGPSKENPKLLFDPAPTYMSLRWQSYVLTYARTIHLPADIWVIGELFAIRETNALQSKQPIDKDDLEKWIAFAPWENDEKEKRYLDAVASGAIPERKPIIDNHEKSFFKGAVATTLANMNERHYLLPSQQFDKAEGLHNVYKITVGSEEKIMRFRFPSTTTKGNEEREK